MTTLRLIIAIFLLNTGLLFAGNRVIVKKFDWRIHSIEHFDIYYYEDSQGWLEHAVGSLERAYQICRDEGLKFVYIGNVPRHRTENTFCPGCLKMIIERRGYNIVNIHIKNGRCAFCGEPVPGLWEA